MKTSFYLPIVFLLDSFNYTETKETIEDVFSHLPEERIYVFAHYINPDIKDTFFGICPHLIWKSVGDTLIYEKICREESPLIVTLALLPELLREENQIVVLHKKITPGQWNPLVKKIKGYQQDSVAFIHTKLFSYLNLEKLRQNKQMNRLLDIN
ncbi:MAG: hypothetical protein IKP96_02790 [Elusimicrobiaceae bacterium]|nr:hypothetical protein [Elusimicrobiaceae bacterium]